MRLAVDILWKLRKIDLWWLAGWLSGKAGAEFYISIKKSAVFEEKAFPFAAACKIKAVLFMAGSIT